MLTEAEIDKALVTLKFIWFALLSSLAVYLFVALQISDTFKTGMDGKVVETLRVVFYLLSFVLLIMTKFVRKRALEAQGNATSKPTPSLAHPLIGKYTTSMMVSLALSEGIGIFGFVLFLLGKNVLDLYVLVGISAAAMFMYRPKKDELVRLAQEEQMNSMLGGSHG